MYEITIYNCRAPRVRVLRVFFFPLLSRRRVVWVELRFETGLCNGSADLVV